MRTNNKSNCITHKLKTIQLCIYLRVIELVQHTLFSIVKNQSCIYDVLDKGMFVLGCEIQKAIYRAFESIFFLVAQY